MQKNHYVGIDVSKNTLDISIFCPRKSIREFSHTKVDNSMEGWKDMLLWLKDQGVSPKKTAFMMEHTGCYSDGIRTFLDKKDCTYRMENPLEIKLRSGIARGKDDKIDSARIADYLGRYADTLQPSHLPSKKLQILDDLRDTRKFYVCQRTSVKNRMQTLTDLSEKTRHRALIATYDRNVHAVEERMMKVMQSDQQLWKSFILLLSIPGIGPINAINAIAITENFTAFSTARQYAAYIGVAPYSKDSGTSVHWKPRPSTSSDLQAKADLSEAADSAIQYDMEMGTYYSRKIKGHEQDKDIRRKAKNGVKFKLILRMFAVIKKGNPYIKKEDMEEVSMPSNEDQTPSVADCENMLAETENYEGNMPCHQEQSFQEAPVVAPIRNLPFPDI